MSATFTRLTNDLHRWLLIAFILLAINTATSYAEIHFPTRTPLMRRMSGDEITNANPDILYYKELLNFYHNEHLQTAEKRNINSMFDSTYPTLTEGHIAVLPPIRFEKREHSKYPTPLSVDNSITMIGKRLFIARIGKRSHIYTARIGRK